ncbi:6503_t:CDS:2 [Funneliformis mosseae]|uniref:6503_t:CDS:1 n=1 Tax=Funneliformis mosseae TaxID=27381 RepID=A0A9N8ZRU0_FUNMO|nr:6503_t:CDS:2 [Funneliformis mosseae]
MENRLRIKTPDGKAYEVDRWCPHANTDLSSRGVVLGSKLVCTKHNWTFALDQGGKCTSADATINACLINDW